MCHFVNSKMTFFWSRYCHFSCRIAPTNPMKYRLIPHPIASMCRDAGPWTLCGSTLNWKGLESALKHTHFFSRELSHETKVIFCWNMYWLLIMTETTGLGFSLKLKKLYSSHRGNVSIFSLTAPIWGLFHINHSGCERIDAEVTHLDFRFPLLSFAAFICGERTGWNDVRRLF